MMKVVHNKTNGQFNPLKEPVWVMGFVSIVVGTVFNMAAMAFGTQVLLSSTSSFSIIFNTVLSSFYLRETLYRSDVLAIFLICFGSTMFLVSAKNDETKYDAIQIKDKYTSYTSIIFYIVAATSMIFC
jgi:drug/metabolite transporter (DMT)-like permease